MGRSCYTSAGAALCIGAEVAGIVVGAGAGAGAGPATRVVNRAAVFPSQAEKTGYIHVRSGRDGSFRRIKLLTRVRVLNKRVATCPIIKVARVKEFLF